MGLGIKSFLLFKLAEFRGQHPPRFGGHYLLWRTKRIQAILDHYGHRFFQEKSVLELGAGYGEIGAFFATLGAKVTCLEGRPGNTKIMRKRYPSVIACTHDLLDGWPNDLVYDVIIHMGVLYHLDDPEETLRAACRHCRHLILETLVSDSTNPFFLGPFKEQSYLYDQALNGKGSRPSPAYVERIMAGESMEFTRINDDRCNAPPHVYDWPVTNSGTYTYGYGRMWFARKA